MSYLSEKLKDIFFRYTIMILVAIPNFWIFYFIFAPLTIYPIYFILGLFFEVTLYQNIILVSKQFSIEFIDACIAGTAYYLLFILNISTPNITLKKRTKMILFSFAVFLIINLIRILILSLLFINGSSFFDVTHKVFWYLGNLVFVAAIWFTEVKLFKIKEIPFYTDIKFFFNLVKKSKKTKGSKKNKKP